MKKTWLHRAVSVLMSGVLLSGMLGTPAAAAQRQVDAYGRDFTRVEGGTYFSERTGESTYRERIPPARRRIITPTTACCAESGS